MDEPPMSRPVLIVAGPTASGKSGLALALAKTFDGTAINGDSMQVYRELRVLTARPDEAVLAQAPHRLYGVLSASEVCSAGRWRALALDAIADAHREGRLPIVTGGAGLYLKSLVDGLAPMPAIPQGLRNEVRALYDRLGAAGFHAALAARDPLAAAKLRSGDRQRGVRAYEVFEATGRSLIDWQKDATEGAPAGLRFASILLDPPREALYEAIERRLEAMIAAGALAEVQALLALGLDPRLPALRAVGVPELARHLAGETALGAAIAQAKQATRRLAKRQTTWFRHQALPAPVLTVQTSPNAQFSESLDPKIFNFIRQFLLTGPN